MAFVHRQSCEGVKSELDLFAVPPTQTSIEHGGWIEHQQITSLDSGGPIEFVVPGARRRLHRSRQHLPARSRQGGSRVGTDIADDTPVAPVNNWLHSLFSQVDVHLNDTLVDAVVEHLPVSCLRRNASELRRRGEEDSAH